MTVKTIDGSLSAFLEPNVLAIGVDRHSALTSERIGAEETGPLTLR